VLQSVQVHELAGVVHGAGDDEVAGVVELNGPDRLLVLLEGVAAAGVEEVPDLDGAVAAAGDEVAAARVEGDTRDPVAVALAGHDEVAAGGGPDLPGVVVGGGGEDGLARVQRDRGDGHLVALHIEITLEGLVQRVVLVGVRLVLLLRVRVHALLLRDGRQLRARLLRELALRVLLLFAPLRVRARPLAAGELLLDLHKHPNLLKLFAERLGLDEQPVALQLHEHLLLDDHLVLLTQLQVLSDILNQNIS